MITVLMCDGTGMPMRHGTIETTPQGAPTPLRGLTHPSDYSRGGLAMNATPNEEWRPIPGTDGIYEVSNLGRVRSLDRTITEVTGKQRRKNGRVLSPFKGDANGHQVISIGKRDRRYVHVLVLEVFVGPRPEGYEACHNDGDPHNNALSNLRWDSASANQRDRLQHGTHHYARRTHCAHGHEYTPENTYVRVVTGPRYVQASETRACRECHRIRNRKSARIRRARKRGAA